MDLAIRGCRRRGIRRCGIQRIRYGPFVKSESRGRETHLRCARAKAKKSLVTSDLSSRFFGEPTGTRHDGSKMTDPYGFCASVEGVSVV